MDETAPASRVAELFDRLERAVERLEAVTPKELPALGEYMTRGEIRRRFKVGVARIMEYVAQRKLTAYRDSVPGSKNAYKFKTIEVLRVFGDLPKVAKPTRAA